MVIIRRRFDPGSPAHRDLLARGQPHAARAPVAQRSVRVVTLSVVCRGTRSLLSRSAIGARVAGDAVTPAPSVPAWSPASRRPRRTGPAAVSRSSAQPCGPGSESESRAAGTRCSGCVDHDILGIRARPGPAEGPAGGPLGYLGGPVIPSQPEFEVEWPWWTGFRTLRRRRSAGSCSSAASVAEARILRRRSRSW